MSYDALYEQFDAPVMRAVRRDAYGEDIGQHSWVTAQEMRTDIVRLQISAASHIVDLGCGPCGPLTFILANVGCTGTGVELSAAAIDAGRTRARALDVETRLTLHQSDLDEPLPFGSSAFDAATAFDVVVHLRDRAHFFREVARVLRPRGRFLFTDACVVTAAISNDEIAARSAHGVTHFVPPGFNEQGLEAAGFTIIESEDRTASVLENANGRLGAMHAHRSDLAREIGSAAVESQCVYLETVMELSGRGALSRRLYLAQR
jgi:SAM-dependent methyltransferase